MFEHLVESGSHSEDLRRKGSFLLGFAGLYIVLLTVAFVAGIWYATANIDAQTLELTALIAPVPVQQQQQQKQEAKPEKIEVTKNVDVRKELIADVTRAELVPKEVSAKASDIPPVRKGVVTMVGSSNTNAIAPVAPGAGTGNIIAGPTKVETADAPPPPKPTPPKAPISGGVLNGKAVRLVQPPYPAIARSAHASGQVRVQIVIDENGNVISATPVSGHPLLQGAATAAARASKFTPTKLSGMPVKVSGVIIYNFVAQ